jgi:deoxyadenosine/deoxycytidine kinase
VDAPVPDLVIYLQAPVDILRERIERRGIRYEQNIEKNYLERLQETYARFFHAYDASPLLIVNAAQADFVNNDHDYGQLLDQVVRTRRGRHYYNPLKSAV